MKATPATTVWTLILSDSEMADLVHAVRSERKPRVSMAHSTLYEAIPSREWERLDALGLERQG